MRAITFAGCRANADAANRRRHAASCTRAIASAEARWNPTPSECEKAHRRFVDSLRATCARMERRKAAR